MAVGLLKTLISNLFQYNIVSSLYNCRERKEIGDRKENFSRLENTRGGESLGILWKLEVFHKFLIYKLQNRNTCIASGTLTQISTPSAVEGKYTVSTDESKFVDSSKTP
mgnify:CR=1 FL=1